MGRRQFLHRFLHQSQSFRGIASRLNRIHKIIVQLIRTQRIRQLPEVHFQQRTQRMNVLPHFGQRKVWNAFFVEATTQSLDVRRDARQPIDAIDNAKLLDELRTAPEHHRDFLSTVQKMLAQIAREHSLLVYAALFETTPRRSGQYETAEERNEFAVFAKHRLCGRNSE